jgi:hypothetical protein
MGRSRKPAGLSENRFIEPMVPRIAIAEAGRHAGETVNYVLDAGHANMNEGV